MGGESEAAWRALLDDLVARGLKTPEFLIVDGAAGLEKALAALWPEVPTQRCTVHKHRNLLAHAPDHLHDEVSADYTDMIYAETAKEMEERRKTFLRKWRLKCRAVADSLEEAGDRLFTCIGLDLIGQLSDWACVSEPLTGPLSRRPLRVGSADRSTSPWPSASCQGRSASASCHNTNGPGGCGSRCTGGATGRGRPAARRCCGRASCGRQPGRTRPARSCGSARRSHSSAGSWSWSGCGRCPRSPGRARTRAAPGCRSIRCRGRSTPGRAGCRAPRRTAAPGH